MKLSFDPYLQSTHFISLGEMRWLALYFRSAYPFCIFIFYSSHPGIVIGNSMGQGRYVTSTWAMGHILPCHLTKTIQPGSIRWARKRAQRLEVSAAHTALRSWIRLWHIHYSCRSYGDFFGGNFFFFFGPGWVFLFLFLSMRAHGLRLVLIIFMDYFSLFCTFNVLFVLQLHC